MTKRIFNAVTTVSLGMLCIVFSAFIFIIYNVLSDVVEEQMMHATEIYADGCERYGNGFIESSADTGYRVTLISPSGYVIFDSADMAKQSEEDICEERSSYLEREEIKDALLCGTGKSSRYSSTVSGKLIYTAKKLSDGSVLRLSRTALILDTLRLDTITPFYIVSACAALLCLALSVLVSRTIVKPLMYSLLRRSRLSLSKTPLTTSCPLFSGSLTISMGRSALRQRSSKRSARNSRLCGNTFRRD